MLFFHLLIHCYQINLPLVANRVIHLYYAGRPLEALQQEIQANIEAMTQLKQDQTKLVPLTILLLVKSFLGGNLRNEIDLKGVEKLAVESGNQNLRGQAITARLELNVFFQEWDDAANLLAETGDLRSVLAGLITMPRFTVLEALISIQKAKAATTPWLKKRKWKKKARKSIKLIGGWVKKGNVNLVHSLHLIVAEIAALEGKNEKAESNYISAITVASRNGFLQDRALSHELASAYFAGKRDEYWKDYHIECCQKCYSEWGATAKLEQLTNEG